MSWIGRIQKLPLARLLGLLGAFIAFVLWAIFLLELRSESGTVEQGTWQNITLMLVLAIIGIVVAWFERPFIMMGVFIASFFPIGLYMLGTPSVFRLIGVADLAYLLSSLIILSKRFRIQKVR